MAIANDVPEVNFRLSMLIYDTRYRSWTIQIIVLILVLLGVAWLLGNVVDNLAAKDKDISFSFLWSRAGYDIDQQLISYTNDDNHFRAAIVGLLNTLVVAFFACILATILGVIVGVLRLSKNWLMARIMTVYVEVFRNVPLLLWIVLSYTVFSEALPEPRDFKVTDEMVAAGQEPKAYMWLDKSVAFTNRGTNVPMPMFDRPLPTIEAGSISLNLNFWGFIAVIFGSFFVNRAVLRDAKAKQEATGVRPVTWWKSIAILVGPFVALLLATGFHLEYPVFRTFNFQGGLNVAHSFSALLLALTLYSATYIAEIVRAGILAISRGQSEASAALGMRPSWTMRLVVLPQSLRVIVPPLISQYLNITKNTTLGMAISYLDLKGTLGGITLNQTGRELECMVLMMAIYLVISLIISTIMNIYNNAMQLKER